MNPRKSLMGFFIALILNLPAAPVQAEQSKSWTSAISSVLSKLPSNKDWVEIRVSNDTVYYIQKSNLEELMASKNPGTRALCSEKSQFRYVAILEKDMRGRYWIKRDGGQRQEINPAVLSAAAASQGTPSQALSSTQREIVGKLREGGHLSPDRVNFYLGILDQLKRINLAAYRKIMGMPADKRSQVLLGAGDEITKAYGDKKDAAAAANLLAVAFEGKLPSVHVGPDAMQNAAEPPLAEGKIVLGKEGTIEGAGNVFEILTKLVVQDPAVRQHISKRIEHFVLDEKTGDKAYVADSVKEKDGHRKPIRGLIGELIKNSDAAKVAALYFAIGDSELPKTATPAPVLKWLKEPAVMRKYFEDRLNERLTLFTNELAESAKYNPGQAHVGQYTGSGSESVDKRWLAYFDYASKSAIEIINAAHVPNEEIKRLIAEYEPATTPLVLGGFRPIDRMRLISGQKRYDFNDLYIKGARVVSIPLPGKKAGEASCCRRISIKIYSSLDEKHRPINEIGIFDISEPGSATNPSNISGKRFALNHNGEDTEFKLYDNSNAPEYKLTKSADGAIKFGGAKSKGYEVDDLSVSRLFEMRQAEAENAPLAPTINGQNFRVLGQGGGRGTLLLFAADKDGKLEAGATPKLLVEVNENVGGFARDLEGPQALGSVGGKFHYVQWNDEAEKKYFEPIECDDEKVDLKCGWPEPPKPEEKPAPGRPVHPAPGGGDERIPPGSGRGKPGDRIAIEECTEKNGGLIKETVQYRPEKDKDKNDPWTVFGNKTGESNLSILCIFGDRRIIFQRGIILKGGVGVENDPKTLGNNFVVKTVVTKDFIGPRHLNGDVVKDEFVSPGMPSVPAKLQHDYYMPYDGLNERINKETGKEMPGVHKLAWLENELDLSNNKSIKQSTVYKQTGLDFGDSMKKTIKKFGGQSPFVSSDKYEKAFSDYVEYLAKEMKSASPKNDAPPHAVFYFLLQDEIDSAPAEKEVVVTTLPSADKDYKLVYCPNSDSLERVACPKTTPKRK